MGTAFRNPGQQVGMLCESASVAAGAALVQGSVNDSVALPSVANTNARFIGLAYEAGSSSANRNISVVLNGVWAATASGTITRGDRLVIASTAGAVASESLTTPPNATRIGVALESVTTGQTVSVLIGANAPAFSGTVLKMTASGAILANSIVKFSNGFALAPAGASPTTAIGGVALNAAADGETVYVVTSGVAVVTDSGAGVTANDYITAGGATGLGLTAAPAGGTNCAVVGIALTTTAASGAISVSVSPSRIQG